MLIQSDDDWKNQAQKEKERLANQQKAREEAARQAAKPAPAPSAHGNGMSEKQMQPTFSNLVQALSSQALMVMGTVADPRTGRPALDLNAAKTTLDMLAMLEEKTQGNLTPEESASLQVSLWSLRDTFVRVAWATRSTAA